MDLFWVSALQQRLDHHPVVILHGNNSDRFPISEGQWATIDEAICAAAARSKHKFVSDGKSRIDILRQETDIFGPVFEERVLTSREGPTCFRVLNMQAAFPRVTEWSALDWRNHGALVNQWIMSEHAARHCFVFVFPSGGLLPPAFLHNIPGVVRLEVSLPELREREKFIETAAPAETSSHPRAQEERRAHVRRLAALTDGMGWLELRNLMHLAPAASPQAREDHVREFRYGPRQDYWGDLKGSLKGADKRITTGGSDPLLGQDEAVEKSIRVLAKASLDMGSLTGRDYRRPRGVLFFVGPTGVGKTMLAKKLAELVFYSADACITFDMSEYRSEHSEARLVGSPPGYVGHDQGGQLTTAVQRRPFSVLLFDEIDKADKSILLKFLQILEEGRLTDGRGQTSYFGETLIIFTSNRCANFLHEGATTRLAIPGGGELEVPQRTADYGRLTYFYREALATTEAVFRDHPEILNRIGLTNIIPFRHLSDREIAKTKLRHMFDNTKQFFADQVQQPIQVYIRNQDALIEHLIDHSKFEELGLRNVQQQFESEVLERLAWAATAEGGASGLQVRLEHGRIVVGPPR